MKRSIVIVLDGCGAGSAPDYIAFGESEPASTLANVRKTREIDAPLLKACGYLSSAGYEANGIDGFQIEFARLKPLSQGGKDSVTGHWEMMGIVLPDRFPTYPNGFPQSLVNAFCEAIGREILGNKPASGTAILDDLGEEHMRTGKPILYTSADSVFQIAAHEEIIPLADLHAMCQTARKLCSGENQVQRVIARPFIGPGKGNFTRTDGRKDFPVEPPLNVVDQFAPVLGIGVVPELFGGRGFRPIRRTQNNAEHEEVLFTELPTATERFIFANFEDFDMRFGHRNDPVGFAGCLERFDQTVARLLDLLRPEDELILTADHGNDPTTASTDHSREYVPFVRIARGARAITNLGDLDGLSKVGHRAQIHLAST
jgi:phosphopentomutase